MVGTKDIKRNLSHVHLLIMMLIFPLLHFILGIRSKVCLYGLSHFSFIPCDECLGWIIKVLSVELLWLFYSMQVHSYIHSLVCLSTPPLLSFVYCMSTFYLSVSISTFTCLPPHLCPSIILDYPRPLIYLGTVFTCSSFHSSTSPFHIIYFVCPPSIYQVPSSFICLHLCPLFLITLLHSHRLPIYLLIFLFLHFLLLFTVPVSLPFTWMCWESSYKIVFAV